MGMMMHRHNMARRAAEEAAHKAVAESPEVREGSKEEAVAEEKPVEKRRGGRPRKGA